PRDEGEFDYFFQKHKTFCPALEIFFFTSCDGEIRRMYLSVVGQMTDQPGILIIRMSCDIEDGPQDAQLFDAFMNLAGRPVFRLLCVDPSGTQQREKDSIQ